ncbi:MAG: HAMP domain-containing sensor histidine kinase [Stygiobacter sp.]
MKLINKISRYFLISSIPIFIIVSVGLYYIIENTVTNETDEQLINISKKVIRELKNGKIIVFDPFVEVSSVNEVKDQNYKFEDVRLASQDDDEGEQFRQLTTYANVNGVNYKIVTRVSLIEKEDMLFTIMSISIGAVLFLVLIMYVTNKIISKKIFKDFYDALKRLESFSIKNDDELQLTESRIEEFEQLNKSLIYLAEKAKSEYRSLKEFSEEMNHEIQTPISVIKSKLELLLQNNDLSEDDLSLLGTSLKNLNKLERINKSILLLNKLEHKELFESVQLNLAEETKNVLNDYNDFISTKNLTINLLIDQNLTITANQSLINILLSNLISNAIKHNVNNGKINIELKNNELIISNTGQTSGVNPEKYFERFYKESASSDSVGLGLTIVKKICDLYGLKISNHYSDNLYYVVIDFTLS